jgi:hypothetical protein
VARTSLTAIDVAINGATQFSETTIGAVGGHAVVLTTALPDHGITLTSSYLAAMRGDIAASHLASAPGGPPQIEQHVLPGEQPGQTHAQACLLDHIAELQTRLSALTSSTVTVELTEDTLERADRAWGAQDKPTA